MLMLRVEIVLIALYTVAVKNYCRNVDISSKACASTKRGYGRESDELVTVKW